ncbi:hypothetical protein [Jeotgalibacillus sp. R-1-5s-1]|uniref:hypothetical protein n=1 Tax=Jeotgalibacillus sp. R-1-5s-1 TaxID=2555897 RepID=UPI00106BFA98|nr:hypothetical protein [Jeotgalibacillus sp. R-1-5s-1]TFE00440.1 hypothetical protein E2491_05160 [Jeotgalibacillus sp. R-1-5s-1]
MMKKSQWNDDKIESLLKKMPVIESRTSAEEIYQHVELRKRKKKTTARWMPVAASLAALLLLVILVPGLMNQNQEEASNMASDSSSDSAEMTAEGGSEEEAVNDEAAGESEESQLQPSEDAAPAAEDEREEDTQEATEESTLEEPQEGFSSVVLGGDTESNLMTDQEALENASFDVGLLSEDGFVIPMTVIVPAESDRNKTNLELYNDWIASLDEEGLGFADYHPLSSNLTENGGNLEGTISEIEERTVGASSDILLDVLNETFGSSYENIRLVNEDGSLQELNQVGEVEQFNLSKDNHVFFIYQQNSEQYFYVPSYESYDSFEQAIGAINQIPNDRFQSALPDTLSLEAEADGQNATIRVEGATEDLTALEKRQFVESILLTAKSFSLDTVTFENVEQDFVTGYDFTQPVEVPYGYNKAYIE